MSVKVLHVSPGTSCQCENGRRPLQQGECRQGSWGAQVPKGPATACADAHFLGKPSGHKHRKSL